MRKTRRDAERFGEPELARREKRRGRKGHRGDERNRGHTPHGGHKPRGKGR